MFHTELNLVYHRKLSWANSVSEGSIGIIKR
jgi:hypothetical protein